jgi:hypothetical protein
MTDLRSLPFYAHIFRVLRYTHGFLTRNGLQLDDFDMIRKRALASTDPLSPHSRLTEAILAAVDPTHWTYNTLLRRFTSSKDFVLVQPSNEKWVKTYMNFRESDTQSINSDHVAALVELLNPAEIAVFLKGLFSMIEAELTQTIALFLHVSGSLWLLQGKTQDDAIAYFRLMCDSYGETRHPRTGGLFNSMRIVGNLTALVYAIECEVGGHEEPVTLSSTIAHIFARTIKANEKVFFPVGIDCEQFVTHRTFPALWCLLEFLLCSPNPVMLSETLREAQPFNRFGAGVVICAHLLIQIAGQAALYTYDSIVSRAIALIEIQATTALGPEMKMFLDAAVEVKRARNIAEVMAYPYTHLLRA